MKANFFVSPEKAKELAAKWMTEHASYYGAPHGASGYRILKTEEALYFCVPSTLLREEYIWCKEDETYIRDMVFPYACLGLTALPGGFSLWITSGLNKAAANPETGEVRIWSRRHGIPKHTVAILKNHEIGEIIIDSFRPELAWWETSKG